MEIASYNNNLTIILFNVYLEKYLPYGTPYIKEEIYFFIYCGITNSASNIYCYTENLLRLNNRTF